MLKFRNTVILSPMHWLIDMVRLAACLSLQRILNLVGVYAGYSLSSLLRRPFVFGGPYAISAEVAAACNLRCPHCIEGLRQTRRTERMLSTEMFQQLVYAYKNSVIYANLYFQGEPFLNRNLAQIIRVASQLRFYTSAATNGHFLDKEISRDVIMSGLGRVVISLDGLDEKTYQYYRVGGDFNKVIEGIASLAATRKEMKASNPLIIVQFLVNRQNEDQIDQLPRFAKKLGADIVQIKTMQVYGSDGSEKFLPENPRYNRYLEKNGKLIIRNNGNHACFRLWSHLVFTADNQVVPCCYDKVPDYSMGIRKGENMWFSPQMYQFRKKVLTNKQAIGICCNCPE